MAIKKTKDNKVERYNLPWVAEQVEEFGFGEKTVRSMYSKIINLLGEQEENLKDSRGQIWFDKELADFLVWTIQHIDGDFLRKTLDQSKDITPEEAFHFETGLLAYIQKLEGPTGIMFKAISNKLAMETSQTLFKKTLENVKELSALYEKIPVKDRIELLEKLNPAMEQWMEDLKKQIANY
jgi:hypothetical protein